MYGGKEKKNTRTEPVFVMASAVVAGMSRLRSGFDHRPISVGVVVNKVALEQVSVLLLMSSYVSVIAPIARSHSFTCHKGCVTIATESVASTIL